MAHEPSGFVGDSGHSVNLMSGHALFAGAHQVSAPEPFMQGNVGVLEHGAHGDTELLTASVAFPDALANWFLGIGASSEFASVVDFSTVRTNRAIGPANGFEEIACLIFVSNMICEFIEIEGGATMS